MCTFQNLPKDIRLDIDAAEIVSAHDVAESELLSFYQRIYPARFELLQANWRWLYRIGYKEDIVPLVMKLDEKVIAHAGVIPIEMMVDGELLTACWYVDFAVLPEFQRLGIGIQMSKKWMQQGDLHITFCNHRSIGVFRKLGWSEQASSTNHLFPLIPKNQKPFVRNLPDPIRLLANTLSSRLIYPYRNFKVAEDVFIIENVSDKTIKDFRIGRELGRKVPSKKYFDWRLIDAPDVERYKVFSLKANGAKAIVKLRTDRNVSLLSLSASSNADALALTATIAHWAQGKGFLNLYLLTTDDVLSDELSSALGGAASKPIFAFHSSNTELEKRFVNQTKIWDLLDSDFDMI